MPVAKVYIISLGIQPLIEVLFIPGIPLKILVLCGSCLWLMLDTGSFVRVCCLIGTDSIIDTRP